MRPISWVITAVVVAFVLFVIAGVTPLGRGPFQSLFAVGEVAPIDFTQMASIRGPAQWLVCPGYEMCKELDDRTPVYDNDVASIKRHWDTMLKEVEPGLQLLLADDAKHQYTYVSRSGFFQLPDLLTVQIFPNGETRGSIAIFSRSVYGFGDFGSNSTRVIRIMDYMDKVLTLYKR